MYVNESKNSLTNVKDRFEERKDIRFGIVAKTRISWCIISWVGNSRRNEIEIYAESSGRVTPQTPLS